MKKRIVTFLLAFVVLFSLTFQTASAAVVYEGSSTYTVCTTEEEVIREIRSHLVNRETGFKVAMTEELSNVFSDAETVTLCQRDSILEEVFNYTGNPLEGGYLFLHTGILATGKEIVKDSASIISYYAGYYSDYNMEQMLDKEVDALLSELNLFDKTDYEKIVGVHDYMVENIKYDRDHLNEPKYYAQFSAYAALVDKKAVCNGYSALFNRLMTELEVECYAITSQKLNHSWNSVKLDDQFYLVDVTWDATSGENKYLLCGSKDFTGHKNSDDQYSDSCFSKAHPLSEYKYDSANQIIDVDSVKTVSRGVLKTKTKSLDLNAESSYNSLEYTSLNGKYITVSDDGLVTIKKSTPAGTYKIKITAKHKDKKAVSKTVKIVVK